MPSLLVVTLASFNVGLIKAIPQIMSQFHYLSIDAAHPFFCCHFFNRCRFTSSGCTQEGSCTWGLGKTPGMILWWRLDCWCLFCHKNLLLYYQKVPYLNFCHYSHYSQSSIKIIPLLPKVSCSNFTV